MRSIIGSLATTPTPELTQLFILEDHCVEEVPLGTWWCSLRTAGGPAFQQRWMLVSNEGAPALVLFTVKHIELFGDGRAQYWCRDPESLRSLCRASHVHIVAYRVLLKVDGDKPRGDPEYQAPREHRGQSTLSDQLHRDFATQKIMEWDRENATVGKFLVKMVKYPFLFFQEAGLGQEDSIALAGQAYRHGASPEGEAMNCAYHEFARYQQWIRNLVDMLDGSLAIPRFIGWMYALPAKCPRIVRLAWWIVRELIVKSEIAPPGEVHKVLIAAVGNERGQGNCLRMFGIERTTNESPGNLITASSLDPPIVSLFPFLPRVRQKLRSMEWAKAKMSELGEFGVPVSSPFMQVHDRANLLPAIAL
jgi:hypothetical protein